MAGLRVIDLERFGHPFDVTKRVAREYWRIYFPIHPKTLQSCRLL